MESSTEEQLTLFAEDSLASRSAQPGSDEARMMTATSGRRCFELYGKYSPLGSLVKTLLASKVWSSTIAHLTWKVSGSRSKCLIFRLAESVPSIEGIGYGLLPTPCADESGRAKPSINPHWTKNGTLRHRAKDGRQSQVKLGEMMTFIATPIATDAIKRGDVSARPGASGLSETFGGHLNPRFVEQMMGSPTGWTDLEL